MEVFKKGAHTSSKEHFQAMRILRLRRFTINFLSLDITYTNRFQISSNFSRKKKPKKTVKVTVDLVQCSTLSKTKKKEKRNIKI